MRQTALSFNLVNVAVLMVVTLAGLMLSTMSVSARHTLAASGKTQQAAAARSTADGFPAAEFASLGPPRRLLAAADEMAVGIANFAALPAGLKGVVTVPNIELSGRIKAPPGGASGLGVTEANELAIILKTELDETPAPASRVTDVLQFPGANLKGSNAGGFPTVWAPFRSGWVFRTSDYAGKPGTVLHFSNVTLALPGETYAGVASSGFLDYLDLGTNSHVCFTNSVLVLSSCQGFAADTYKMWCCAGGTCDNVFTQERIDDLGIGGRDPLAHIPCISVGGASRGFK